MHPTPAKPLDPARAPRPDSAMHQPKLKSGAALLATASWRTCILLGLACGAISIHAAGQELPRFGKLPDLGRDWKVRESGTNGTAARGFSWMVFTNAKTGDPMSFAAYKYGDGILPRVSRGLWSSTAGEIFPAGYPAWTAGHPRVRVNWLRNDIVEVSGYEAAFRKPIPKEALQYSIVFEDDSKPGTNRLAHGYAVALGEFTIYVQNTSIKPIISEDAESLASQLISLHAQPGVTNKSSAGK